MQRIFTAMNLENILGLFLGFFLKYNNISNLEKSTILLKGYKYFIFSKSTKILVRNKHHTQEHATRDSAYFWNLHIKTQAY